jgi:hypothetical protein
MLNIHEFVDFRLCGDTEKQCLISSHLGHGSCICLVLLSSTIGSKTLVMAETFRNPAGSDTTSTSNIKATRLLHHLLKETHDLIVHHTLQIRGAKIISKAKSNASIRQISVLLSMPWYRR